MTEHETTQTIDGIIKLGGSVLTNKSSKEEINLEQFEKTLECICSVWKYHLEHKNRPLRAVLVHGAGSFGHPHAKAGKVALGSQDSVLSSQLLIGFCDTRLALHKLSCLVIDYLIRNGVPAALIPAFPTWKTATRYENGQKVFQELIKFDCNPILEAINAGMIPVIHGDCVFDESQGSAVVSGDLILDKLAQQLRPKYVVFVSDVNGIYDQPPKLTDGSKNPDAKIIPSIQINLDGSYILPTMSIDNIDVTGGMAGKLNAAAKTAGRGMPVTIVCGGTESMFDACLGNKPKICTTIMPPTESS